MVPGEDTLSLPRSRTFRPIRLGSLLSSPRLPVYALCTVAALLTSCLLGKDMRWDTLDYHFYAGFSALHDRFSQDYFAAGSQSYFNPYAYVPFYLLSVSGLPAIAVASVLAVVQSGILWLTYELAREVLPANGATPRLLLALCAVALAFANPILINEFGSSYADVTTAEIALGGWLLLARALRGPRVSRVVWGALLLGAASALKPTNSVHAVSAALLLLFVPAGWRTKLGYAGAFALALVMGFGLVSAPWSIHLARHFGNPVFPLLNEVFRSTQYPIAKMLDYRFIPDSVGEALRRPFSIAAPRFAVDDELQAPDLRYAALLVCASFLLLSRTYTWLGRGRSTALHPDTTSSTRALAALGCSFIVDWSLWLVASANGRYFIAMACVAAVLVIGLIAELSARRPKLRNYLLAVILGSQALQLSLGTDYRNYVPWAGAPWFDVQVPTEMVAQPALYLSYGMLTNSFVVPFLAPQSGFVNIAGDYPLAPQGANGAQVRSLIRRYAPHLWLLVPEMLQRGPTAPPVNLGPANDALLPFRLRADPSDCQTIKVANEGSLTADFFTVNSSPSLSQAPMAPDKSAAEREITNYLAVCPIHTDNSEHPGLLASERRARVILDRLEDACPKLFQPARAVTQYYGKAHGSNVWARRYLNTNLTVWVSQGWVHFVDPVRGGPVTDIGPESAFQSASVPLVCGRKHERYFARVAVASSH